MGLEDRDWYREDYKRRQALSDKPSKPIRRFALNRKSGGEPSVIKTGIYTILALAVFTLLMRFVLKS